MVDSKFGEGAIAAVNGERVAAATEDKLSEKKLLNCVNNLKESVSNVKGRYAVLPSSSLLPNAASGDLSFIMMCLYSVYVPWL